MTLIAYPLPLIDDILDSLGTSTVFSSLDMRNAFFLISIKDNNAYKQSGSTSVEKNGFITKCGSFEMALMGKDCKTSQSLFKGVLTFALPLSCINFEKVSSKLPKFLSSAKQKTIKKFNQASQSK
jgi:hypothetical protein